MAKFIITGGKQRTPGHDTVEWNGYDRAVSLIFDEQNLKATPFFEYTSPAEHMPIEADASITFKSASIKDKFLVISTSTEIMKVSLDSRKLDSIVSLPIFNDVHHAFINTNGNYIVTSTGLDAVFEVTDAGEVVNEWSASDSNIWEKFDDKIDYRKVLTTKPHPIHPNHCTEIEKEYWVTRFEKQDILNLCTRESISIPFGRPHDGLLADDSAYFTHVNGIISKIDFSNRKVEELFDVNAIYSGKKSLGWCRGLCLTSDHEMILGFSRLRSTKYEDAIHWAKRLLTDSASYYGCKPTRLAKYDFKKNVLVWEFDLEPHDINAVFSILPLPD
ncbi:MAG: hypothetical protein COA96_03565 [SAR86 cluster bacterium]|uniref:Uncharacterized protein n=1 Tax=SAR86 cluster bacterium TaxID=2030880 RepID=A0A2A5B6R8_9GAMM|nr:MAG: hypothetical protein COA96_03565 [SAR86 cluster bacterium]